MHLRLTNGKYHTPSFYKRQAEELLGLPSSSISDFDGHAEFTVASLDDLKAAFSDPYYKSDVEPDENKFFEASTSVCTVGWEEVKVSSTLV